MVFNTVKAIMYKNTKITQVDGWKVNKCILKITFTCISSYRDGVKKISNDADGRDAFSMKT